MQDFTRFVLSHEAIVRLFFFLSVFTLVAAAEALAPRRHLAHSRRLRWTNNLGLVTLDTVLVRLALPVAATTLAIEATGQGWGLLNWIDLPAWIELPVAVVALDLAIYVQHVTFHAMPLLWRLHRVHHADLEFDLTTGVRFHPLEILLSAVIKLAMVAVLGPHPLAVVLFEILLNATSTFNHANLRIPEAVERYLRWLVVTPDMHRVHHSAVPSETNSNFGFNLPWWDRLFGTYREKPAAGHEAMTLGIECFRTERDLWLDRMLLQPFRDEDGRYPADGRERLAR